MKKKVGFILGKFYPPHQGHEYLINFAANLVDQLYIVVGTLKKETIAGQTRFKMMQNLFPEHKVLHLTDENPQYPEEDDNFWNIWQSSLKRILPESIDYVFASENYGSQLAEVLQAQFIPVDMQRNNFDISASAIRNQPYKNWQYIPTLVKPYYTKKVCIFGPESSGKTTLAKQLAKHYHTKVVNEYARTFIEFNQEIKFEDMLLIAERQRASEQAILPSANKILFSDTDVLTTSIWSQFLFNQCDPRLAKLATETQYHLTLLLYPDIPWVKDPARFLPEKSLQFFNACEEALKLHNRDYQIIKSDHRSKLDSAISIIDNAFSELL